MLSEPVRILSLNQMIRMSVFIMILHRLLRSKVRHFKIKLSKLVPVRCKDGEFPWKMPIHIFWLFQKIKMPPSLLVSQLWPIFVVTSSNWITKSCSLVYDGHGGSKIASHVSRHLHKYIVRRQEYKEGKYEKAIVKGFLECDEAMKTDESLKDEMSGSTAITLLHR